MSTHRSREFKLSTGMTCTGQFGSIVPIRLYVSHPSTVDRGSQPPPIPQIDHEPKPLTYFSTSIHFLSCSASLVAEGRRRLEPVLLYISCLINKLTLPSLATFFK